MSRPGRSADLTLTSRQRDDLILLCLLADSEPPRYAGAEQAAAASGEEALPALLDVPGALAGPELRDLVLRDAEGAVVAQVAVETLWPPPPAVLARLAAADDADPTALPPADPRCVSGVVRLHGDRLYASYGSAGDRPHSAAETRRLLAAAGSETVLGVVLRGPLDVAATRLVAERAARTEASVVILPLVGAASPLGLDALALVRCARAAASDLLPSRVLVCPLPLVQRPGARAAARAAARAYGATDVLEPRPPATRDTEDPPPVFSAAVTEAMRGAVGGSGFTVLLTGYSGSGKSTIGRALDSRIRQQHARATTLLDGDVVRLHLSAGLGFSREDRDRNVLRIGWVAGEVTRHGGVAICAPIAPYDSIRRRVRAMVASHGGFLLVHVDTPLEVCESRDVKGLYAKARAGLITGFTGIDDPYEPPEDADLVIDTTEVSVPDAVSAIEAALLARGWLAPAADLEETA